MSKTPEEIKKINKEEVEEIEKDLQIQSEIDAYADSKAGKILVTSLLADILSSLDRLCSNYDKLTLQEFIALSAGMKSNKDLVEVLTRAKGNKEFLDKLLKEALQKE